MTQSLSRSLATQVAECAELLLSPFGLESPTAWRAEVVRRLRPIVRADMATFQLPIPGGGLFTSEGITDSMYAQYKYFLRTFHTRYPAFQRMRTRGVVSRRQIWWGYEREFRESALYNDLFAPHKIHDALVLSEPDAQDSDFSSIFFNSEREKGFGRREISLLLLLRPAFRSGVATIRRLGGDHERLHQTIDLLPIGVALYTTSGMLLHRNRVLSTMLHGETDPRGLDGAVERAARAAGTPRKLPALTAPRPGLPLAAGYHVHASLCPGRLFGADGSLVMVTVERGGSQAARSELFDQCRLTPREREVALLLADGHSNAELARRLTISVHTAERHVEHVLSKLGLRSRAQIAALVARRVSEPSHL